MKTKSNITTCPNCKGPFPGKPWEPRVCKKCGTWMSPDYFHPDAPKSVQVEGKLKMTAIARSLIGAI